MVVCDAGHANGPEIEGEDEKVRFRSQGGYMLLIANKEIAEDQEAAVAVMDSGTSLTRRVCRSTLAAEAAHLAEGVEQADWLCVFMAEILDEEPVSMRNWQDAVDRRKRIWCVDAKSVYDYLTKEGTGHARDRRMAIEGALLKEALQREKAVLRWIDGTQNIADILTKIGVDKTYLKHVLNTGIWTLVQHKEAALMKEKKRNARQKKREVVRLKKAAAIEDKPAN